MTLFVVNAMPLDMVRRRRFCGITLHRSDCPFAGKSRRSYPVDAVEVERRLRTRDPHTKACAMCRPDHLAFLMIETT